jgi:hypothetical protein
MAWKYLWWLVCVLASADEPNNSTPLKAALSTMKEAYEVEANKTHVHEEQVKQEEHAVEKSKTISEDNGKAKTTAKPTTPQMHPKMPPFLHPALLHPGMMYPVLTHHGGFGAHPMVNAMMPNPLASSVLHHGPIPALHAVMPVDPRSASMMMYGMGGGMPDTGLGMGGYGYGTGRHGKWGLMEKMMKKEKREEAKMRKIEKQLAKKQKAFAARQKIAQAKAAAKAKAKAKIAERDAAKLAAHEEAEDESDVVTPEPMMMNPMIGASPYSPYQQMMPATSHVASPGMMGALGAYGAVPVVPVPMSMMSGYPFMGGHPMMMGPMR